MNESTETGPAQTDSAKTGDVNIVWHEQTISPEDRAGRLGQRGCVIWFTGLSGCGKSTIANALDRLLFEHGSATTLLDGDNVRHGLCAPPAVLAAQHGEDFAARFGLGFGAIDREENIRRIGAVCTLMASSGLITLAAFVSPYRRDRDLVRQAVESAGGDGSFLEVFVDTPLEICKTRDPKGLYKKAIAGEIKNFTGISDPYESPESPEIHLQYQEGQTPLAAAKDIYLTLQQRQIIGSRTDEDR